MDALETSYETKLAAYNALVAANDPTKLTEIQSLNGELGALLHTMLEKLAAARSSAGNLETYRDALVQKLVKIQNDASIMLQQRDQYNTLHMLQTQEEIKFNTTFFWYAIALGIAAFLFVFMLMWKGGIVAAAPAMPAMPETYDALTMPTTTTSPTTMAALT